MGDAMVDRPAGSDRPFDIVVFDLGGVLVRIVHSWAEGHERAGFAPHPILDDDAFHRECTRLLHSLELGNVSPEVFAAEVASGSRGAYTADDVTNFLHAWQIGEYADVGRVLDAVDAVGLATGALSNTNALHWREVREAADEHRFPTVRRLQYAGASHLLGLAKPDPAIFRVFQQMTEFSASRILFFDDREENVQAARAAGWHAEQIDHTGDTADQLASHLRALGAID